MRVHSWGQTAGVCGTQAVSGSASADASAQADASADCTTQVVVSKQTALIQRLGALKSSDPVAFKSVAGRVAEHFMQRAAYLQGSDGEALHKLGVAFASAAQSGDLSAFQSPASAPVAPTLPAAPAPPTPAPVDALASAFSLVDSITETSSASAAESFAKLSALKQSNPGEFKQLMNRVSEGLSHQAHYAEGADRDSLSAMAVTFASAAQNGDISAFAPASEAPPPAPSAPPPPPAPPPLDALSAAYGLVDSITETSSASDVDSFAKLSALKQSNPGEFKQLMNRVSEGLSHLAHYAEGADRDNLSAMAVKFASAAQSGDISAFAPASEAAEPVPSAPSAPPAPPPPAPVDALSVAFGLVDSIAETSSASGADSFAKLSALKQSSPSEFKQLMNRVSEGLSQLAHYAEGADRDNLSAMAVRFASAGQSGDISAFAPASSESMPPPATAPAPEPSAEPAPSICSRWLGGQARDAYRNCASAPLSAVEQTYASALALVHSLTCAPPA